MELGGAGVKVLCLDVTGNLGTHLAMWSFTGNASSLSYQWPEVPVLFPDDQTLSVRPTVGQPWRGSAPRTVQGQAGGQGYFPQKSVPFRSLGLDSCVLRQSLKMQICSKQC